CKENKEPPVGPPGPVDTAEQVGFGVRTLLTANGVQRGELQADTMFVYNDQTKFDFRNARVKFNTETGAPNGTMRADRGLYDTRTRSDRSRSTRPGSDALHNGAVADIPDYGRPASEQRVQQLRRWRTRCALSEPSHNAQGGQRRALWRRKARLPRRPCGLRRA